MEAGDCYRQAGRELTDPTTRENLVLCHGYPTLRGGPHYGERFGHAWLEFQEDDDTWTAYDPSTHGINLPRDVFYALGNIDPQHVRRYTRAEAVRKLVEHRVWGPWEDDPEEYDVVYAND